jgi:hypothetical protein
MMYCVLALLLRIQLVNGTLHYYRNPRDSNVRFRVQVSSSGERRETYIDLMYT